MYAKNIKGKNTKENMNVLLHEKLRRMNSNILMLLCIIIRCVLGVFGDLYA
jgi:cell division protein FtsL